MYSDQKQISLENIHTGEIKNFNSLIKASDFTGVSSTSLVTASKRGSTLSGTYKVKTKNKDQCIYCSSQLGESQIFYCSIHCRDQAEQQGTLRRLLTMQRLRELGATYQSIGNMFGVTRQYVYSVCNRDYSHRDDYESIKGEVESRYKQL